MKNLELEISSVFYKKDLTIEQKKDALWSLVENTMREEEKDEDFTLFSTYSETNHTEYKTKNGHYSLIIAFDSFHSKSWYFYVGNNPNITASYNSLWEGKSYKSEEECVENAEKWLKNLFKK